MNHDLYRLTLTLAGPVIGPVEAAFQADTFFGHLCWALLYREGEAALADFLARYQVCDPPLVLSNGFPGDLLPRPFWPPPPPGQATLAQQRATAQAGKQAGKAGWLPLEAFNRALQGQRVPPAPSLAGRVTVALKNRISRLTGATGQEGSLYTLTEGRAPTDAEGAERISFYLRLAPEWRDRLAGWLDILTQDGYGGRKSVGYGEIAQARLEPFAGFNAPDRPNAFLSLANFTPACHDPTDGYYRTMIKYGKLGEELARGENPFKRPLVMLRAGSCFRTAQPRPWYGRMVSGLSAGFPPAVQYGLCLALPLRLPEDLL